MAVTQQRYMRRGVTKFLFLKAIEASTNIPTRPELGSPNGTDLSAAISDIEGWALENTAIDTPDMASEFTSNIPGEDKADNSSLTFYEDKIDGTLESLLSKGVEGYIVILRKGDIAGSEGDSVGSKPMDIFPVRVGSRAAAFTASAEPAKFKVSFAVTAEPTLDAAIPAAA
ncbi:phage tail tube protein [Streptomyces sp. NPDC002845]